MNQIIATVIAALAFVAICAGLLIINKRGLSSRAKKILLGLVAEAETLFGQGTGEIKFSVVLGRLYTALPAAVQFLFSEETVASWIEDAVAALKAVAAEEDV